MLALYFSWCANRSSSEWRGEHTRLDDNANGCQQQWPPIKSGGYFVDSPEGPESGRGGGGGGRGRGRGRGKPHHDYITNHSNDDYSKRHLGSSSKNAGDGYNDADHHNNHDLDNGQAVYSNTNANNKRPAPEKDTGSLDDNHRPNVRPRGGDYHGSGTGTFADVGSRSERDRSQESHASYGGNNGGGGDEGKEESEGRAGGGGGGGGGSTKGQHRGTRSAKGKNRHGKKNKDGDKDTPSGRKEKLLKVLAVYCVWYLRETILQCTCCVNRVLCDVCFVVGQICGECWQRVIFGARAHQGKGSTARGGVDFTRCVRFFCSAGHDNVYVRYLAVCATAKNIRWLYCFELEGAYHALCLLEGDLQEGDILVVMAAIFRTWKIDAPF